MLAPSGRQRCFDTGDVDIAGQTGRLAAARDLQDALALRQVFRHAVLQRILQRQLDVGADDGGLQRQARHLRLGGGHVDFVQGSGQRIAIATPQIQIVGTG